MFKSKNPEKLSCQLFNLKINVEALQLLRRQLNYDPWGTNSKVGYENFRQIIVFSIPTRSIRGII